MAIKAHSDGGTYEVLQTAGTINGFGIAITRWTTYRDEIVFEVYRYNSDLKMLRLGMFKAEPEARVFANKIWKQDR